MNAWDGMRKQEILAHVGSITQIAGVTRKQVTEGNGEGMRLWDVKNGSQMEFSVLESKCMDLFSLTYKGIPLAYVSKNGLTSPLRFVPQSPEESLRNIGGGLLYTCGLSNVGNACETEDGRQVYHGRLRAMSATDTAAVGWWEGDDYLIELRGQMRETAMFGENLVLRRKITTRLGQRKLWLRDEVENEGHDPRPFMIMYHMNLGYPLLDEGDVLVIPTKETSTRDPWTETEITHYREVQGPSEDFVEQVLYHKLTDGGQAISALVNPRLGLGLYIKQDTRQLPYLHEWKSFHSGDYALGLEPANCHCEGRQAERSRFGGTQMIGPFQTRTIDLEIGILDGRAEIARLMEQGQA